MARHIEAVEIVLGGKKRRLIFDHNALVELHDQQCTFAAVSSPLKLQRAALWACLLADTVDRGGRATENTLSIRDVGDLLGEMSPEQLGEVTEKVNEAMRRAHPEVAESGGEAKAPDPLAETLPAG